MKQLVDRNVLLPLKYCLWLGLIVTLTPIIGWLFLPGILELTLYGNQYDYMASVCIVGLAALGCLHSNEYSDRLAISILKSVLFAFGLSYLLLGYSTYFYFYLVIATLPAVVYAKKLSKAAIIILYVTFLVTANLLYIPSSYSVRSERSELNKDRYSLAKLNNQILLYIETYGTPPNTLIELKEKLKLADSDITASRIDDPQYNSRKGGPLVYFWNSRHGAKSVRQSGIYIYSRENFEHKLPYLCTPRGILSRNYINVAMNGEIFTVSEDHYRLSKNIKSLLLLNADK